MSDTERAEGGELNGIRILLVEDEYLVALEMQNMIRMLGGEVVGPAGRIDDAMQLAREGGIDGAVVDLNTDGEVTMRLIELLASRNVPFVVTTGYDSSVLPPHLKPVAFLTKPISLARLKAVAGRLRAARAV
jgi:DNA-binding NarL/FixJ family response regulator